MSLYRWRCGDPNQAWSPDQFWIRFAFGDHSIIVHRYYTQIVGLVELYHLPKYDQNRFCLFWEISKKPNSPCYSMGKFAHWKAWEDIKSPKSSGHSVFRITNGTSIGQSRFTNDLDAKNQKNNEKTDFEQMPCYPMEFFYEMKLTDS